MFKFPGRYKWDMWCEMRHDIDDMWIPSKIFYRQDNENRTVIERDTFTATLDELASAIAYLEEETENQSKALAGLLHIERKAHRVYTLGTTTIGDALGCSDDPGCSND